MKKWPLLVFVALASVLIGALAGFIYWNLSDLPEIKSLESYKPLESTFIYSADGKILAELFVERRSFVPYYTIPDHVKKAFVAIEDQRFYSHPGVDVLGILRAIYKDVMAHSVVEGGSTITQQLAKMLFLKPEKSISRKIKEAIISAQIERRYTKDEILGMYLNQAYFGTRAYGIEAAAQTYFGKSVREASLPEAALLASLQKAPSTYSPFKNPERALTRRSLVLRKMVEDGYITEEDYERAKAEPLPKKPNYRRYNAPYFVEFLKQQLDSKYNEKMYTSGLKIYSTIDSVLQGYAEEAVKHGIEAISKRVKPGVQVALIAIDPRTGYVKALVGGTDFWETQFNRATMALRQPGSAFKPFVYVSAIEKGMTSEDLILDGPISFPGAKKGVLWSPKNYDGKFHGPVTLRKALALSLNTATVRLAHQIGIKEIIETAQRCGIKSTLQPYLPLSLGASDVTLLELTSAYGVFATGYRVAPITYEKILNREGVLLEETFPSAAEALAPETVEHMKTLLKEVVDSGTAQKAKELKRPLYGKTGTTNEFSDAWFIGFDDRLVVGVWVGRDNHKPIGNKEAGARVALPIWIEFMKNVQ